MSAAATHGDIGKVSEVLPVGAGGSSPGLEAERKHRTARSSSPWASPMPILDRAFRVEQPQQDDEQRQHHGARQERNHDAVEIGSEANDAESHNQHIAVLNKALHKMTIIIWRSVGLRPVRLGA